MSFHPFPRPPRELRELIWSLAAHVRPSTRREAHFVTVFSSCDEEESNALTPYKLLSSSSRSCLAAPSFSSGSLSPVDSLQPVHVPPRIRPLDRLSRFARGHPGAVPRVQVLGILPWVPRLRLSKRRRGQPHGDQTPARTHSHLPPRPRPISPARGPRVPANRAPRRFMRYDYEEDEGDFYTNTAKQLADSPELQLFLNLLAGQRFRSVRHLWFIDRKLHRIPRHRRPSIFAADDDESLGVSGRRLQVRRGPVAQLRVGQ
ncbi:hypothetical protein ACJZ2D_006957 [Fusarium nematophilum]